MIRRRVADKPASSNRDNNLANSGTQTTAPRNVLLREERTRSRTRRNRTRVDSEGLPRF
jgi:hypothetical protein